MSNVWGWYLRLILYLGLCLMVMPAVAYATKPAQTVPTGRAQVNDHFPTIADPILPVTVTDIGLYRGCTFGQTWDSPIKVSFDRAMDPTTVDGRHVQLTDQRDRRVTITVGQNSARYEFIITPHEPLVVGQLYTVSLSSGIISDDQQHTPLTPYSWHFRTTDSRRAELVKSLAQMQRVASDKIDREIELTADVVASSAGIRDSLSRAEFFSAVLRYTSILGAVSDIPEILRNARSGNRGALLATVNLALTGYSPVASLIGDVFVDDVFADSEPDPELVDILIRNLRITAPEVEDILKSPLTRFMDYGKRKTRIERRFTQAMADLPDPLPCTYPLDEIEAQGRMLRRSIIESMSESVSVPTTHGPINLGVTSYWRTLFIQSQGRLQSWIRTKIVFTVADGILTVGGLGLKQLNVVLTPQDIDVLHGVGGGLGIGETVIGWSNITELQEILPTHLVYSLPIELATVELAIDDYLHNTRLAIDGQHTVIVPPQRADTGDIWDDTLATMHLWWNNRTDDVSNWWHDIQDDLTHRWQDGRRSVEQWGRDRLSDVQGWSEAIQEDVQQVVNNWLTNLERGVDEWLGNSRRTLEEAPKRDSERVIRQPSQPGNHAFEPSLLQQRPNSGGSAKVVLVNNASHTVTIETFSCRFESIMVVFETRAVLSAGRQISHAEFGRSTGKLQNCDIRIPGRTGPGVTLHITAEPGYDYIVTLTDERVR